MTLRMVFDRDDLQRVRVADAPDPMWELVLSLHRAQDRRNPVRYVGWLRQARQRARRERRAARWLQTLFTLVPPKGSFPDFLTPAPLTTELSAGCEAVVCTPRARLQPDVSAVFTGRAAPDWVRELATGDRARLQAVVGAVRGGYDLLVAPHWHHVRDAVAADRATRVGTLAKGGVGALLADLPGVRGWDGQALDLAYPESRTVHLTGRGLTLVPSYFCVGTPVTLIDSDLPPVLIYPAAAGHGRRPGTDGASRQLAAVLGRTRADCLAALDEPHTTSALAARLDTSIGNASRQATVLREAGLISSERHGGAVLHHLTRLGVALLAGDVR